LTATETLTVQRPHAGVAVLQLNRPKRLNAIDDVMVGQLKETLASLAADTSVNAVVLTGAGRGFCSGIDMRDFGPDIPEATAPAIDRLRFQERMAALPQAIRDIPQPVIAAVNGPCVGAGLALCLAVDIRICSTTATFGDAAILLGLSGAEMGMSYFLPRIVGASVAAEWMLTGRIVSAEEADRRGLVSELVEPALLSERALEIATRIAIELRERRAQRQIAAHRGHVEHPAAAALAHGGDGQLGQMHRRQHMHFDHQPRAPFRELVEGTEKRHSGVVDQDVGRTATFDHFGEESLPVFGLRQVGLDSDGRPAGGGDLLERLPKRSVVFGIGFHGARGEPDRGAFGGQSRSDRLT
jgi:enoyl-CoA hydratase